jgi:uncharacterized membrane protein YgaE (UPF0421/DUF939 family)
VLVVDVLQNAKTVLAGVVAWVLATEVFGLEQAFLAPWAAVLAVHATAFRTVSRAGQQVVGTFAGVVLAWASAQAVSPSWLAMGVMLAASFLVAAVPWMRDEGTNIATTGIVVLATNAVVQENLLVSRLIDTTVGIVVGLAVNLLVWPPLRDQAALSRVQRLPLELAGILAEMAEHLRPDLPSQDVEHWVRRCREVDEHIDEAWGLLRQATESSRLNPRRSRPADLEDLSTALHLMEQAVADTLSMSRTVATSAERATLWSDEFRTAWAQLLTATATATTDGDTAALREVRHRLAGLAGDLSTDELARSAWHEYGGLLVNLRNIARSLGDVVEWRAGTGTRPGRARRYPPGTLVRRLPARRHGYPDVDDHPHP